ncbi:MAG: hypothetical protein ACXITV_08090 [Luteibaculaceae bacterium]
MQKVISLFLFFLLLQGANNTISAQRDRVIEFDLLNQDAKKRTAQQIRAFSEIRLGAAIPGGAFSDDITFEDHGYAQGGFTIQLAGGGYLNRLFAVSGTVFLTSNRPDLGFLNDTFNRTFEADGITPPGSTDINAENWLTVNIFGGGNLTLPFSDAFKLDLKAQAGLAIVNPANYRYFYEPLDLEYQFDMQNTVGWGYLVGAALKIAPSRRNAIVLGVDYTSIEVETNSLFTKRGENIPTQEIPGVQQRRINNILITIGFSFAF